MLYFAYGSNLHPLRLAARTPSCTLIGDGELPGHALRFHKLSVDESGKCNALATGRQRDTVFGALYRLDPAELLLLDAAERVGTGYWRRRVEVWQGKRRLPAFTYVADPDYIDDRLRPYHWYLRLVELGALYHRLPDPYRRRIVQERTIADPDAGRASRHRRVIRRMEEELDARG